MHLRNVIILFISVVTSNYSVHGQSVVCPSVRTTSGWLDLFPLPCTKNADCSLMGARHLCCKGYCTKGVKSAALRATEQSSPSSVVSSSSSSTSTTTTTTTTSTTTTSTTTPSTTTSSTTTARPVTTTARPTTTTTEPPRPFLQILPIQTPAASTTQQKSTKAAKTPKISAKSSSLKLVCPKPGQAPLLLFPVPCQKTSQCKATGADQVCCEGRCVRGVPAPKPTTTTPKPVSHQPFLGVIPRECPSAPLGELLFEVQQCKTDAECWPRVCCPDGKRSYCRTARARLDLVPVARQIDAPVRMLEKYLQCTPPPQYDLFPRKCSSSVDCFPNLCCAEGGNKHCRPPQRSVLALLAGVTQRVGNTIGNLRQTQASQNKV